MWLIGLRIIIALTIFSLGIYTVDLVFQTDILGAIGRMVVWFWRMILEFLARLLTPISKSLMVFFKAVGRKTVVRKILKPVWRALFIIPIIYFFGNMRLTSAEGWLGTKQRVYLALCRQFLRHTLDLPRGLQACIALVVLGSFVWLFIWTNEHLGNIYGLAASVVLWWAFVNIKAIGFDALVSIIVEKWVPARRLIRKHRWIRWLWVGPFWEWLTAKEVAFREWHDEKNDGKGLVDRAFKKDKEGE